MSAMAYQITGVSTACSTVCSSADQRKHQTSASLAFVSGIHWWPVVSHHKGPVTRKCFHLMTSSWQSAMHRSNHSYEKTNTLLLCIVNMICFATVIGKNHTQSKGSWSASGIIVEAKLKSAIMMARPYAIYIYETTSWSIINRTCCQAA